MTASSIYIILMYHTMTNATKLDKIKLPLNFLVSHLHRFKVRYSNKNYKLCIYLSLRIVCIYGDMTVRYDLMLFESTPQSRSWVSSDAPCHIIIYVRLGAISRSLRCSILERCGFGVQR